MTNTTQDTDREELTFSDVVDLIRSSAPEGIGYAEAAEMLDKAIEPVVAAQRKAAEIEGRIDELKAIYAWSSEERDALVFAPEHRSEDYAQMAANGIGTRITVRERIKELQAQKEAMK